MSSPSGPIAVPNSQAIESFDLMQKSAQENYNEDLVQ
jgi:hypothetical protein